MSKLSIKAGRPSSAKTTLSLDDVADKMSTGIQFFPPTGVQKFPLDQQIFA